MKKNILLAPNSFKECADSIEVADMFEKYLISNASLNIIKKPISDGGDGFLKVCKYNFKTSEVIYHITTPYDNIAMQCKVEVSNNNKTLYIESANVLGLKMIPKEKRQLSKISSRGMGLLLKLISADIESGKLNINKIVIGIGGTGTNDLGLGACSEFGLKLLDKNNNELDIIPENYILVKKVIWEKPLLPYKLEVIVDVDNPLLGDMGATKVFGPQKGGIKQELLNIEKGFVNIVSLLKNNQLWNPSMQLSGAGGGLAAGLQTFFGAKVVKSVDFILYDLGLIEQKYNSDILITGEGAFDYQSLMQKGSNILIDAFKDKVEKIFLCVGVFDNRIKNKMDDKVHIVELNKYFNSTADSISNFNKGIEQACSEINQILKL